MDDRSDDDKIAERQRRTFIERGILTPFKGAAKDVFCMHPDAVERYRKHLIKHGFLVPAVPRRVGFK